MLNRLIHVLMATCIYLPFSAASEVPMLNDISDLEWKNRVVIVSGASPDDAILEALNKHKPEVDDRDIIWFVTSQNEANLKTNYPGEFSADAVKSLSEISADGKYKVLLIGKDGGIKLNSNNFDLERIFTLIDGMPMRIREMNSQ